MTKTKNQKARAKAQKSAQPKTTMVKKVSNPQPRKGLQMKMGRATFEYLVSSLFPFTQSARLPDICMVPTTTFVINYDTSLSLSSGGVGGFSVELHNWPIINLENVTTTTDSTFTYNTAVPIQNTAIASSFGATRPVSASFHVYSTNSDLNNSGRIFGWTQAGNTLSICDPTPTSVANLQGLRDNYSFPAKDGIFIRYKPLDVSADFFAATSTSSFTRGVLGVHINGAAANAIYVARLTVNYECLAYGDNLSYQAATTSPHDGPGYDIVKGIMSRVSSFATYGSIETMLGIGNQLLTGADGGRAQNVARRLIQAYGAYIA